MERGVGAGERDNCLNWDSSLKRLDPQVQQTVNGIQYESYTKFDYHYHEGMGGGGYSYLQYHNDIVKQDW